MTGDTMLYRVRKLLAMAENPGATPEEAESFNRKASELIARHGIEQAMLETTTPDNPGKVVAKTVVVQRPYAIDKLCLLNNVATRMRCRVIRNTGEDSATVVGYESDINRAETIFTSLLVQMSMGLATARTRSFGEDPRTFAKAYFAGFTSAVAGRLDAAERAAQTEARETYAGNGAELVLADRKTAVDRRVEEMYPKLTTGRARGVRSSDGYGAGHSDGSRANVGVTSLGRQSRAIGG